MKSLTGESRKQKGKNNEGRSDKCKTILAGKGERKEIERKEGT